jgi:dihydroorotate dehydrogenase
VLVEIAPDLTSEERRDIAQVALEAGIDGLIISNTTVECPHGIVSRHAQEAGRAQRPSAVRVIDALLAEVYRLTQGRLPLIGVGGIASVSCCGVMASPRSPKRSGLRKERRR